MENQRHLPMGRIRTMGLNVQNLKVRRAVRIGLSAAVAVASVALVSGGEVMAHPGHGTTGPGNDLLHYLVEPSHGWAWAGLTVMASFIASCWASRYAAPNGR